MLSCLQYVRVMSYGTHIKKRYFWYVSKKPQSLLKVLKPNVKNQVIILRLDGVLAPLKTKAYLICHKVAFSSFLT